MAVLDMSLPVEGLGDVPPQAGKLFIGKPGVLLEAGKQAEGGYVVRQGDEVESVEVDGLPPSALEKALQGGKGREGALSRHKARDDEGDALPPHRNLAAVITEELDRYPAPALRAQAVPPHLVEHELDLKVVYCPFPHCLFFLNLVLR